ncbi:PaaI family thioesterase [Amycolatopsis decaplanina]|uniref:Medium/long-chain acyl-CoA thioesterase YigI n=1 Tax=Amycolatopsis decaplanina DSM 44594 TaxID=1284240 RepID=M2ZCY3_9PSEU|nr:PaaI family thioesterase [Amycolatopsis decaplanina]EME65122.1 phenylacetic acid degradation protein [Amycolatopsis decaplanina DSM 44594]
MTALTLEDARKGLASQPFSVLLGTRVTAFGDGAAALELDIREDLLQQNGYLHGGVLAYAADNAITFAAGTTLGPAILTSGFSIEYLRPAKGIRLVAEAQVLHSGRRQATCRCDLHVISQDGIMTLSAVAQGSVMTRNRSTPD